jgi:hypothetical protein
VVATEAEVPRVVPASFISHGGDVSWEFVLGGAGGPDRVVRAGVRLAARRRLLRQHAPSGGPEEPTDVLLAHAAAALALGAAAPDAAGVVWVTPENLERVAAHVRSLLGSARPVYRT